MITLTTTLVGQQEYIKAFNTDNPSDPGATFNYAVGYGDLYYNDHTFWKKIGGSDTSGNSGHGTTANNRYMTSTAANGLYNATVQYLAAHVGVTQLCTNDMALPYGGKFDICNMAYNGCTVVAPWTKPHISHDRGSAADVAGPSSSQCPFASQVNVAAFLQSCVAEGAVAANSIPEGNHAHCNWLRPGIDYPD